MTVAELIKELSNLPESRKMEEVFLSGWNEKEEQFSNGTTESLDDGEILTLVGTED